MQISGPRPQIGLGVIAPPDFTRDRELWRWVPDDVTLFISRTGPADGRDNLTFNRSLTRPAVLARPAREVRVAGAEAIAFACTACSFVDGPEAERALRAEMGMPAVTAAGAAVAALNAVEARRVAVVHPYARDVAERLTSFLTTAGFDVVATSGTELRHEDVTYAQVADLVTAGDSPDADAIFVSCTGLPTFDVIAPLERSLEKPVVTANEATMWALLKTVALAPPAGAPRPQR